jgi:hypothetical protein
LLEEYEGTQKDAEDYLNVGQHYNIAKELSITQIFCNTAKGLDFI